MTEADIPIVLVVAMARNRVIGLEGTMPWRLPSDLKHFKARTLGKPVIMGRKTYESIGKPLPGRHNIVVTRQPDFAAPGCTLAASVDAALGAARASARETGADEICVLGGAGIYAETLPHAARLYVTEVAAAPDGDTWFPEVDPKIWREVERSSPIQGEKDQYAIEFVTYERAPQ